MMTKFVVLCLFAALFIQMSFGQHTEADCLLELKEGLCRMDLPRYYFDGKACKQFSYGGCDGNANNFETLEECVSICHK
ncbi:kunitz-type serine protease inhibitor 2 [Biomphalaria pfeifferi]|uniref:Kunitz-type serine protease inhibitor 2 n=1 Tax=Biomphalaria pfeifferi TaxID=112525 RepID=A0AAD8CAE6_BIOPF|nr:kunitz-type serine protease inhibitor 2 [Biomphalaria pfeifferi]